LDPLNAGVTFSRRKRSAAFGASAYLPLPELKRNPVELTVTDGELVHSISAERGKSGKVWLTCQCAQSRAEGWCRHRLDLLCQRYGPETGGSAESRSAFERIVSGTPLSDAGHRVDGAMKAFGDCLEVFDARRPRQIVGPSLGKFTDLVSDLAVCSGELEEALGNLRRLLERN
jgi:hypothetical protein